MKSKRRVILILILITLIGGYFRFFNINWDNGGNFHPDELNIAVAVTKIKLFSEFNPDFYQYGTVIIYVYRIIGQFLVYITNDTHWVENYSSITLIGRYVSAAISTATIPLIFLMTFARFGTAVGLLSSFFIGFSPLLIQTAHFSTTDTLLMLIGISLFYISDQLYKRSTVFLIVSASILSAFALSTKASGAFYILMPIIAIISNKPKNQTLFKHIHKTTLKYIYFFICLISAYIIIAPMTFVAFNEYIDGMIYERSIVNGNLPIYYTFQFIDTKPLLYAISQMPITLGLSQTILGIIGFIYLVIYAIKNRSFAHALLLIWTLAYFIVVSSWHVKFVRYMIPLFPFLCIFASIYIDKVIKNNARKVLRYTILISVISVTTLQGLAFIAIYKNTHTRFQAFDWIVSETPENSKFLIDDATEFLPESSEEDIQENSGRLYKQIPHFGLESEEEIINLAYNLSQSQYYVIGTRRQLGVALNHRSEFPMTSHFYDALYDGSLGYTHISSFSSYPTLSFLGKSITFPDDAYEETIQVFDHPTISIFQNTEYLNEDEIMEKLYLEQSKNF